MFLKWIVSEVEDSQRAAFHEAQLVWGQIRATFGLIAQIGGWNRVGHEACILAFWKDRLSHERFLTHIHDSVTDKNLQAGTYRSVSVALADGLIRMGGAAPTIVAAANDARFLRVADCQVHPANRNHFVDVQLGIWEPGMAKVSGQLGGAFSAVDGGNRFLVTTLWDDETHHDRYVEEVLPGLRAEARPELDLEEMTGRGVRLEPEWSVLPRPDA